MHSPFFRPTFTLLLATTLLFFTLAGNQLFAGVMGPPGDGGLQIVFSDDGAGNTAVSASGSGQTNNDGGLLSPWLGFSDDATDRDLTDTIPMPLADLPATMGEIALSDTISFTWTGLVFGGSPRAVVYDGFGIDQIFSNDVFFFESGGGMGTGIEDGGAVMSVTDGSGTIPLPYSTFASVHGMSFASEDGFTFVFSSLASTPALPATPGTPAIPDLQIGKKKSRLKGDGIYDKRNASNKQTLVQQRQVFSSNTAKAALLMQNDGGTAAQMKLRSSGDHLPRMKVRARAGGHGNITGALKRGGFTTTIPAGGSVSISYKLSTDRFFAGVTRNGDRDDTIRFQLSGNGRKDNAAMIVKYRD